MQKGNNVQLVFSELYHGAFLHALADMSRLLDAYVFY